MLSLRVQASRQLFCQRHFFPCIPALPEPPVLYGKNSRNTAMQSAQRKLQRLFEAAAGPDPVAAVSAIHTARGNTYLNACDNYKTMLLQALSGNGVGEGSSNAV